LSLINFREEQELKRFEENCVPSHEKKFHLPRCSKGRHISFQLYACKVCGYNLCSARAFEEVMDKYTPRDDGSHQWLGVSIAGMLKFLEHVGFIVWEASVLDSGKAIGSRQTQALYDDQTIKYGAKLNFDGWKYSQAYCRSDKLVCGLDEIIGAVAVDDTENNAGLKNMTGYYLCEFLVPVAEARRL
jgi:hypothetical protein